MEKKLFGSSIVNVQFRFRPRGYVMTRSHVQSMRNNWKLAPVRRAW